MTELKPCPFCGSEAIVVTYRDEQRRLNPTVVGCTVCKAQSGLFDRKGQAVEAWNRRDGDTD
jgi:Lar family restriction alleviation protein